MKCACNHHLELNASKNKNLRLDPTRTTVLRQKFVADIVRRFTKLKKEIMEAIVDQDVFGLKGSGHGLQDILLNVTVKQFNFPRSSDKIAAFMRWLKDMEELHILAIIHRPGRIGQSAEEAWTDIYIESAYKRGILRAGQEMKKAGISTPIPVGILGQDTVALSFNKPVHVDRVGLLYTRVFNELKGITNEMDKQISRTLAEGLTEGRSPRQIARMLVNRVDKIAITRGKVLARTEIVRAHHMASIQEYKNAGLLGVQIMSEWLTAGFNVCPACAELEGKVFTLAEIEPMIPVHPNCRCTAIPYLPGISF